MKNFYLLSLLLISTCTTGMLASSVAFGWTHPQTEKTTKMIIVQGDILKQKVDAVVNAANEELRGGGGVCGALFKAAGWNDLQTECSNYAKNAQGVRCATGDAVTTSSCALKKRALSISFMQ